MAVSSGCHLILVSSKFFCLQLHNDRTTNTKMCNRFTKIIYGWNELEVQMYLCRDRMETRMRRKNFKILNYSRTAYSNPKSSIELLLSLSDTPPKFPFKYSFSIGVSILTGLSVVCSFLIDDSPN